MKNNITKLINYFAFAIIFFSVTISFAQPLVQVPSACNVVDPGIGGSPGFGGLVGDGGIVCMPDPFDDPSPNGEFYEVNGYPIIGWTLYGDISEQTSNTPPSAGTYSAGPVSFLNIESYNKDLRYAEDPANIYPQSDIRWARSKGKVRIDYKEDPCDRFMTFEIIKNYDPNSWVPPIEGPDCLEPNSTYTFSVDRIASDNVGDQIGFDEYYWSGLPAGSQIIFSSADNSSITFTTGATVTSTTITCCYGRCNDWDANLGNQTMCVSKFLNSLPTAPSFSSTQPVNSCLNTGVTSFPIVISNPVAGYNYTLTAPGTTWVITNNSLGNWTVNTANNNNPGTLILTINNGSCAPVVFSYQINRNFVAPSISITSSTCLTPGTAYNFTIPTNALLNPTTWILPSGWASVSQNATNSSINVTVPLGTPVGSYTIQVKSNACPGIITTVVYVKPATPVFTVASPFCVTRGTIPVTSIAINPVPGATGYSWTLPTGWTFATGSPTNTTNPTLIPNAPTAAPVSLTVTALGVSGSNCNSTATLAIKYNPVQPANITNSCVNYGVAGTATITVGNRPLPFYGTYTVTCSPSTLYSGTPSVNASTGIITINTLATAPLGTYTLTITHSAPPCGNSNSTTYTITVGLDGLGTFINHVPNSPNSDVYVVTNALAGSTFQWYYNGTIYSGPGAITNSITLYGNGTAPTSIYCIVTLPGGCKKKVDFPVGTHSQRIGNSTENGTKDSMQERIKIYPNPNNGDFTIQVSDFKESATALLTDSSGRKIASYTLSKGENKIENKSIASGTYFVIIQLDDEKETRKIIVN